MPNVLDLIVFTRETQQIKRIEIALIKQSPIKVSVTFTFSFQASTYEWSIVQKPSLYSTA